jgi:hypothetical protein
MVRGNKYQTIAGEDICIREQPSDEPRVTLTLTKHWYAIRARARLEAE